ncbi:MAG: hypothetical protein IT233_12270 [Bacteroidia bacterium]|nr:hypothetical protein [Bacteroidia bacterium]
MIVLGVHQGHDSSAAIVKDGQIVADVQEERFARVKHSANAPIHAINYCLRHAGLKDINEIDCISVAADTCSVELIRLFGLKENSSKVNEMAKRIGRRILRMPPRLSELKPPLYFSSFRIIEAEKIKNYNHHLAHAASAYFTRNNAKKCLIFTVDGAGDRICTAIWQGEGNEIKLLKCYDKEAAIGWAYSIVTEGLHWIHGDGEGKTMGLAPYGNFELCEGILDDYFPQFENERLIKPSKLGKSYYWSESGSMQFHLDEAYEAEKLILKYGRENVAAEAQRKLEECVMHLVYGWVKKTGINRIAFAGGVMLNVKLNQRIWNSRRDLIVEQHVYPNPGDSGLAVGAAFLEYYRHHKFNGYKFDNLYLGPEYSNEEIEKVLKIRKVKYTFVDNPAKLGAELLAKDQIIAWFQGRMESGPRALGNRSILMSPLKAANKDIINASVKFREGFRPFCPSLTYESRHEYLKDYKDEFFMITSYDVTDHKREKIPAVVHVDGTLRPQMVQKETNPRYWELINEFGKLTGETIVLNSSFNVMGESIVNTPQEAIRCFYDSGVDALIIGNYYLKKGDH